MHAAATSKEAILRACRDIVAAKGLQAVNMRSVADACHVALGSLYHYFPSKDDLLIAAIESVWQDIFLQAPPREPPLPFPAYIRGIFQCALAGKAAYPNFFSMHALPFANPGMEKARETMERYLSHMRTAMEAVLAADGNVNKNAFSPRFPREAFVEFVLSSFITQLFSRGGSCDALVEIIGRTIY